MDAIYIKSIGEPKKVAPKNGKKFSYDELRDMVGGYIEIIFLTDDKLMVVNEEGKLIGLETNLIATRIFRTIKNTTDYIVGDALVCPRYMID